MLLSSQMTLQKPINLEGLTCDSKRINDALFFSLVDYRNNYFTSNEPNKIIEFYKGFENKEQLIDWMVERPKGVPIINEVEGSNDIVVVIPTSDIDGKFARECKENIFKGLHIIFVRSGGGSDFYFNFAHYVNSGIKKAMEYNLKWVVFSGDDMNKLDDVSVLEKELKNILNSDFSMLLANPHKKGLYVSKDMAVIQIKGALKLFRKKLHSWIELPKELPRYTKKINFHFTEYDPNSFKFHLRKFFLGYKLILFSNMNAFGILSGEFLKNFKEGVFDETFINGFEDIDLSLKLELMDKFDYIKYNIAGYEGSTLGNKNDPVKFRSRHLRDIANYIYINYKLLKNSRFK